MNSPLALVAAVLWLLLAFLAIRACRKWAKGRNTVKVIYKNHPAIPVKQYKLADFETDIQPATKPTTFAVKRPETPLASPRNVWDI